jgi:integrase
MKFERGAMQLFFLYLCSAAGIQGPPLQQDVSAAAVLLRRYGAYLREDRGLAKNSVLVYTPFIRDFLAGRSTDKGCVAKGAFDTLTIRDFLLAKPLVGPKSTGGFWPWRFGRFCASSSFMANYRGDLSPSVPMVRRYRQTIPPAFLSPEEVERVLTAADRLTSTGHRDHAILLLLARLGLRAGEIAALELDDIRWRAREIVVRGKGRMRDPLPLLSDIGEALAAYIREDRGVSSSRRVFLRTLAPHTGLAGPAAVGHIVRRALARAGVRRSGRGTAHPFPSWFSDQNDSPGCIYGGDLGSPPASLADDHRDLYPSIV